MWGSVGTSEATTIASQKLIWGEVHSLGGASSVLPKASRRALIICFVSLRIATNIS